MAKNGLIGFLLVVVPLAATAAGEAPAEATASAGKSDVLNSTGMAVMGNNEAPKSLTIVPWKTSEGAVQTNLSSTLLDENLSAVDKEVFMRQIDFHEISKAE